jgi:acyl-[acyl-carrier-protein] desaturase
MASPFDEVSVDEAFQPGPLLRGGILGPDTVRDNVQKFLRTAPADKRWDPETEIDWAKTGSSQLTEGQRSAVEFITIVEDHLPGYFDIYGKTFPVDGSVDTETYIHNRELYHFTIRWAQEEDAHARALAKYQLAAGMATQDDLRLSLAAEGMKAFSLPYDNPVQLFTYPLLQEKATQLYYQHLKSVVEDPVLKLILTRLSQDEARHFSFFSDMVTSYLVEYGDAVVEPIKDVVANFRMPLADTMNGYWRWALKIADTAAYDHTDAYAHLINAVHRACDTKSDKVNGLLEFVGAMGASAKR